VEAQSFDLIRALSLRYHFKKLSPSFAVCKFLTMTPFEYVTVLISIILGLGITQIVTGVADIIHQWEKMKLYWPHALWIWLVFIMHIHEWWNTYDLRQHQSWYLISFLFVILYPIILFVLARILFPFGNMEAETDFKVFYFSNYRKFFLIVIVLASLAIAQDLLMESLPWEDEILKLIIVASLSVVALKKWNNETLHKLIVLLLLSAFVGSLAVLDYTIK
jgi:hypothetical protein